MGLKAKVASSSHFLLLPSECTIWVCSYSYPLCTPSHLAQVCPRSLWILSLSTPSPCPTFLFTRLDAPLSSLFSLSSLLLPLPSILPWNL